jgi:hypothetical protein
MIRDKSTSPSKAKRPLEHGKSLLPIHIIKQPTLHPSKQRKKDRPTTIILNNQSTMTKTTNQNFINATPDLQFICFTDARLCKHHSTARRYVRCIDTSVIIYSPEILREADALMLPTLPLVLRTPALSLPRKLSPLRIGLPRTLLSVLEPLPDFIAPGVFGRVAVMFSMSLLLSLSMDE